MSISKMFYFMSCESSNSGKAISLSVIFLKFLSSEQDSEQEEASEQVFVSRGTSEEERNNHMHTCMIPSLSYFLLLKTLRAN